VPSINASLTLNKQRQYNVTVLAVEASSSNALAKVGSLIFCLVEPRLRLLLGHLRVLDVGSGTVVGPRDKPCLTLEGRASRLGAAVGVHSLGVARFKSPAVSGRNQHPPGNEVRLGRAQSG
jgi:hypothetical protein